MKKILSVFVLFALVFPTVSTSAYTPSQIVQMKIKQYNAAVKARQDWGVAVSPKSTTAHSLLEETLAASNTVPSNSSVTSERYAGNNRYISSVLINQGDVDYTRYNFFSTRNSITNRYHNGQIGRYLLSEANDGGKFNYTNKVLTPDYRCHAGEKSGFLHETLEDRETQAVVKDIIGGYVQATLVCDRAFTRTFNMRTTCYDGYFPKGNLCYNPYEDYLK